MGRRVFAKFPFKYARTNLDRGEVIELKGTPNDERLVGLNYFVMYDPVRDALSKCERDGCQRVFAGPQYLLEHRKKKGGCMSVEQKTTNRDTAELLGVDVQNLKMPEESDIRVDESEEIML